MNDRIARKLRAPAIGLIISGILNGAGGAIALISGILRFSGLIGRETLPSAEAEKLGYLIGTLGGYGVGFLSLIAAPIIVFGGIRMLKGQSRGSVTAAAVLSILPVTSCCFFVGVIFGVWTLIIMRDPQVQTVFLDQE